MPTVSGEAYQETGKVDPANAKNHILVRLMHTDANYVVENGNHTQIDVHRGWA